MDPMGKFFLKSYPECEDSYKFVACCATLIKGTLHKQVCILVGCVPAACCPYLPACTTQGGCLLLGGRGCLVRGVCSRGGGSARGGRCLLLGEAEGVSAMGSVSSMH